jgi:hypothetical protein
MISRFYTNDSLNCSNQSREHNTTEHMFHIHDSILIYATRKVETNAIAMEKTSSHNLSSTQEIHRKTRLSCFRALHAPTSISVHPHYTSTPLTNVPRHPRRIPHHRLLRFFPLTSPNSVPRSIPASSKSECIAPPCVILFLIVRQARMQHRRSPLPRHRRALRFRLRSLQRRHSPQRLRRRSRCALSWRHRNDRSVIRSKNHRVHRKGWMQKRRLSPYKNWSARRLCRVCHVCYGC